jgi:putative CRISPR-associated protein (TIGR02619 family)
MRTILTTTGISLLTNATRELKIPRSSITEEDLRHFFEKVGPKEASAETNSLLKVATPDDEIVLLYTNTPEGIRCVRQVQNYLESQGWNQLRLCQLILEQNEAQFERQGLRHLVDTLIGEITKAQQQRREVIINATGGFKAEIAYTTMVGMIFQVPVKYIYQDFQQPITFPALPVTWNIDLLLEYDHFFEWIDTEPRPQFEVEQRLKAIPDRDRVIQLLLPPDPTGIIYLSPAGDILWQRVSQQRKLTATIADPPDSEVPTTEKLSRSLKGKKHHFPQGTKEFAEKVANLPAVEEIISSHFENTTLSRVKGVSDDGSIRVLWADNIKAANLTIRTTAKGQTQTLKFCDRYIRPLLDA